MKPAPSKRRVLTAREKLMRRNYTLLVRWTPHLYGVFLTVGVQSFGIGDGFPSRQEAVWTRNMLAIALARIEL